ncbi:SCP2 sterol-binding domain-containing protein [Streptomyces sp. MS1.AVA.3]|uniref:SCP2 sterol-binding domain-containing protein n=1 Tax=Streptomyces decoyicus TaxID=249567 RepID=UPI0030BF4327
MAEFLVNLPFATPFAPGVAHLRGNGETLLFRCTDTPEAHGDWLVRLRPDGFRAERQPVGAADTATADAAVSGAAADLLLLLYGRLDRGSEAFESHGDEELLSRWFTNSAF